MIQNKELSLGGFFTLLLATAAKARHLAPAPSPLALWRGTARHDQFTARGGAPAPAPGIHGTIGLVRPADSYLLQAFQRNTSATYRASNIALDLACNVADSEGFECTLTGQVGDHCVDGALDQDQHADETHIAVAPCVGSAPTVRFSHSTGANVPASNQVSAQSGNNGFTVSYKGPASLVAFSALEEDGTVLVEGKIRPKTHADVNQATEVKVPGFTVEG